jgi:hypothetical protein
LKNLVGRQSSTGPDCLSSHEAKKGNPGQQWHAAAIHQTKGMTAFVSKKPTIARRLIS